MTTTFSVRIGEELVTVSVDAFSMRAWQARLGKLQHQKYLLEKKRNAAKLHVQKFDFEIELINKEIMALNSEEAKQKIEEAEEAKNLKLLKRHIGQLNAEQIMLEFFGQDAHDKFLEERQYIFKAKDKETYKITPEGTVFKQKDNEWEPICLIRPRELPLPDFIVSAITSVKTQPEAYERRR